ncbi:MAG: arginyltransferase [Deltaproteobacteria bacterium]|nr:arginyltransferase [Deltaproteobacteria bacterium]
MRVLDHFVAEPRACAYLPEQIASLEYKLMLDVTSAELDQMLERGWRRFGPAYFRPACAACSECVPLRIPVDEFEPSRGQRRVLKKAHFVELEIGPPLVDRPRLELYRAWHRFQAEKRGWDHAEMDARRYFNEFAFPHPSAREFAYFDRRGGLDRLIAVALVDETPNALSAVYTYHHPEYQALSLGTFSILRQIEAAQRAKKRHLYLGYRVLGCISSEYKANFRPHELMRSWPAASAPTKWIRAGSDSEARPRGAPERRGDPQLQSDDP